MLRTEAETAREVLTYTYCYRQLLLAKDQEDFRTKLKNTTQKLVPSSAGNVDVKLSVSPSRPAPEQAIVPVSVQLSEKRLRPRWVTAKATIEKPDMCTLHTVYSYLKDVASATILEQRMQTEESLIASDKGPIGLANLEPPNEEFARKLMEWDPSTDSYETHFKDCGFRVLRVNRLMHAWFPKTDCSLDECEKRVFCYHLYNSPGQKSPCFNCPCLYLYKRYLNAQSRDEIKEILQSLEVRTSVAIHEVRQKNIFER